MENPAPFGTAALRAILFFCLTAGLGCNGDAEPGATTGDAPAGAFEGDASVGASDADHSGPFEPLPSGCIVDRREVSLDEETSLGRPRELIEPVVGTWSGSLQWLPDGTSDEWDVTVEPGATPLELALRYEGGAIHHVSSRPRREGDRLFCPTLLDIELQAALVTEDGVLEEHWTLAFRLVAGQPDLWSWHYARQVNPVVTLDPGFRAELQAPERFERILFIAEGSLYIPELSFEGELGAKALTPATMEDDAVTGGWLTYYFGSLELGPNASGSEL